MLKLQKYQFKFLTISRRMTVGLLMVAGYFSITNIADFNKARKIESMSRVQFSLYASNLAFDKLPRRTLEAVASQSIVYSPPILDVSEKANRELLTSRKACINCQNRLVFFDLSRNGQLTDSGLAALKRSFYLSPYGEDKIMKWRLQLAAEYWASLDDDLRKSALSQITVLTQTRENRVWLKSLSSDIPAINERLDRVVIDP